MQCISTSVCVIGAGEDLVSEPSGQVEEG